MLSVIDLHLSTSTTIALFSLKEYFNVGKNRPHFDGLFKKSKMTLDYM